jgi:hypothetical protein
MKFLPFINVQVPEHENPQLDNSIEQTMPLDEYEFEMLEDEMNGDY